jgi:DNA-binding transcriptional ArsR family regulator
VSEEPDLESVVALLDDEYARSILTATSVEPMSATELSDRCDTSLPTVYRRVERLQEAGLVTERDRLREDGHHDTVYAPVLEGFSVRLRDGRLEFDVELDEEDDAADRLTDMWGDL